MSAGSAQLWAGLGNPGAQHRWDRHNVGFMVVEAVARRHGFAEWRDGKGWRAARGEIGGVAVFLLEPLTYMNLSGGAVQSAAEKFRLKTERILVIHDELDLSLGRVKVKTGGGDAGHNGLRSITAVTGADYRRLRVGIGRDGGDARDYVLSSFSATERAEMLTPLLDAIAENVPYLVRNDEENDNRFLSAMDVAMSPLRGGATATVTVTGKAPKKETD